MTCTRTVQIYIGLIKCGVLYTINWILIKLWTIKHTCVCHLWKRPCAGHNTNWLRTVSKETFHIANRVPTPKANSQSLGYYHQSANPQSRANPPFHMVEDRRYNITVSSIRQNTSMPTKRNSKQFRRYRQEDCNTDCEAEYYVPRTIPNSKLQTISNEYRKRDLSPDREFKPNWRANQQGDRQWTRPIIENRPKPQGYRKRVYGTRKQDREFRHPNPEFERVLNKSRTNKGRLDTETISIGRGISHIE